MHRFSNVHSISLLVLSITFLGLPIEGAADEKGMGHAEVTADSQKAFAEASASKNGSSTGHSFRRRTDRPDND
jgi:hypothetical protein